MLDAASVQAAPVTLLTAAISCGRHGDKSTATQRNTNPLVMSVEKHQLSKWCTALTAVGRLLVGFVLAVSSTVACQAVIDAVAIPTLKLIHAVACGVLSWERTHTYSRYLLFGHETRVPSTVWTSSRM